MKYFTKLIPVLVCLLNSNSFQVVGQTNVSGGIFTNTTWSLVNSPYIITDTVVVFPGVTLTIEPGVIVKFDDSTFLEIRQSKLIAIGIATDSITFTSNSPSPVSGIYPGIYLNGGNLTSTFNYCNISYASIGISVNVLDSVVVSNSDFEQNERGLQFVGNAGSGQIAKIDNSVFDNNTFGLVLVNLSHATISYCNFSHDSIEGFYLTDISEHFSSTTSYCNFSNNGIGLYMDMYKSTIDHCNFSGNNYGLKSVGFQSCCAAWNNIMKNCIFNYNQTGINNLWKVLMDSCTISHNQTGYSGAIGNGILNSTIDSNSVIGISGGGDSIINCNVKYNGIGIHIQNGGVHGSTIEYNTFKNIEGSGVISQNIIRYSGIGVDDSDGTSGVILTNNTIENNNVGIRLNNSTNTITCNSICNNTTYDLQYGATANIDVSHNYWCNPDSTSLEALIYDGYDNINYGIVSFMPIDSLCSPVVTTSINEITQENLQFVIFPNPATDYLTVELPAIISKTEIKIFNLLGELKYSSLLTRQNIGIDISALTNGLYIFQIMTGDNIGRQKFIKQ